MDQPPCFKPGHVLNACARALYAVQVTQHQDFAGPWAGWKMRGKEIVSPDGDRICPERLRGLLFSETNRKHVKSGSAGAVKGTGVVLTFRRVQHRGG